MPKKGERRGRPVMELRISGISDGEHPFSFTASPDEIELDSFVGAITVQGTLKKFANQFFVSLLAEGEHVAECDRCLCELLQEIQAPLNLYYRANVGDTPQWPGGDEDVEMRSFNAEQESIVLDDEVRQILQLGVPLKSLCREDCRGLCSSCGADLNREECDCAQERGDPRWEKLAGLFGKEEN